MPIVNRTGNIGLSRRLDGDHGDDKCLDGKYLDGKDLWLWLISWGWKCRGWTELEILDWILDRRDDHHDEDGDREMMIVMLVGMILIMIDDHEEEEIRNRGKGTSGGACLGTGGRQDLHTKCSRLKIHKYKLHKYTYRQSPRSVRVSEQVLFIFFCSSPNSTTHVLILWIMLISSSGKSRFVDW